MKQETFEGILELLWLPRSARPGSPVFQTQLPALRLDDGTIYALEREAKARELGQIHQSLMGNRVRVEGVLAGYLPLWGPPEAASIVMQVIEPVTRMNPV